MDVTLSSLPDRISEGFDLAVVIDVFRACSAICYAIGAGAARIIPLTNMGSARKLKRANAEYVLMGEFGGRKPADFDLGNSPTEILTVGCQGKTLVHVTSAGTKAIQKVSRHSRPIIVGSFVNAVAVRDFILRKSPARVLLLSAGWMARARAIEDDLCGSYIRSLLLGEPLSKENVRRSIERSASAARFFQKGPNKPPRGDLDLCLDFDRFCFVPIVSRSGDNRGVGAGEGNLEIGVE